MYMAGIQARATDAFVRFGDFDLLVDCGSGWEPGDGPCYWDDAPGESSCFRHNLERVADSRRRSFVIQECAV